MKKIDLIKNLKRILVILIFFLATGTISVFAASQPSNIVIGKKILLDDYFGYGLDFNHKQTIDGQVIYCVDYLLEPPYEGMNLAYSSEADAGITYIMQNGYPNKKITGDNRKDYFITQLAIWIYTNSSSTALNNIKNDMKNNSGVMYDSLNNLVNGANAAKKTGYVNPTLKLNVSNNNLSLSSDGKYYVSEQFGVTTKNVTGNYKVTLSNAPAGTLVQTVNGKNASEFSVNTKFVVKVPVSSVKQLQSNFNVNVSANGVVNKTYIYKSSNRGYQRMIIATLYPINKSLADKANLVVKTDKVVITKTDSETGKSIAGATLAVKDASGKEIMKWVTTTNSKIIMNLPVGKYTLYEVEAPNGYEKTEEVYNFEIKNNGQENKIDVPNITIKNDKVVINKIDSETGKNIAGATLAIKDASGKEIMRWVTTTSSKVINDLPVGKYTLYEVEAPNGYEKTEEVYNFEIKNKDKEIKIDVPNVELVHTAQVEISKQDVTTSKELPGAKLTIKDNEGNVVDSWVSSDKPHYLTLEVGKYILIEEIAPEGYILSKEEIEFEITKNTKDLVKKVMYNTPEPKPEEPKEEIIVEVPKTDVNASVFYGLSASISALGYGLMKKFGRK